MPVLAALLGWAIGVVVNLLADSLPATHGLRRPQCPACGAPRPPLAWPSLAGLVLGRSTCAYCGTHPGARGAVVELATISLAVWLWDRSPTTLALGQGLVVTVTFLLITIIDLEHRLILHVVSFPGMIAVGLLHALDPSRGVIKTLAGGAFGFALVYLMFLLGGLFARGVARLRRQSLDEVAFGFGDVTLATVIGLAVGWPGVVLALFLGILAAGAFSLVYVGAMLARRRYIAFTPIPYGPFLILGAWVVYFGGRPFLERLTGG
jgi:prepilin signal peptidase PulO-like enzyme (type II secretory pathway)